MFQALVSVIGWYSDAGRITGQAFGCPAPVAA